MPLPPDSKHKPQDDRYRKSRALQGRAHEVIPGGCHTYAKGDDQYPLLSPGFIARGKGCRVWDVDGNEFIEYGMGLRSVVLGHGFPEVIRAVQEALAQGSNFTRPAPLEVECAEALLEVVKGAEMVKFAKNGSDVTTAAVKLARALTGRDMVGICSDHPFFSTDDWFIGTTAMNAGIPQAVQNLTVSFRYNDVASVRSVFERFNGRIAALVMEPATTEEPTPGFLAEVRSICHSEGALLVFDEMITGFRWALGGAQALYGIEPDLSAFGKALGNGFSVSALLGKREILETGGLRHKGDRVFLLSTTHGGETHSLAAALATIRVFREKEVIDVLHRQGQRLRTGVEQVIYHRGLGGLFQILGRASNLVFATMDRDGERSQAFRTLFLQELLRRGVLAPSFVVSFSHDDAAIDQTVEAVDGALGVYARALEDGAEEFLVGDSVKPVFRRLN
ncbi:MAG: glutamate-1-semialdehyde 2,1-aminomutase [Gemmatimonadota bacterium]